MSRYLKTVQKPYIRFRNAVAAVETIDLTTGAEGTHTNFFANGYDLKAYKMGAGDNGVQFAFEMNADEKTASVTLFAKPHGSDLEYIGEYALVTGAMTSDRGKFWVHGITETSEAWEEAPVLVDELAQDRMARIKIDGTGAEYILCLVTTLPASTDVSCWARGY